jgi:hypothetical protein
VEDYAINIDEEKQRSDGVRGAKRPGALVALIGVPAWPDAQAGHAHQHLKAIARRAGLDYLPRETKLPEEDLGLAASRRGRTPGYLIPGRA